MILLTKQLFFTTSTVIDWVDIFSRPAYRHIVVESLDYCQQQKGLRIYAWVLMTNHLHMVPTAEGFAYLRLGTYDKPSAYGSRHRGQTDCR